MTHQSIREYAQAIRERYSKVSKAEKGKILDEFTKVTGLHRKATIRLLRHEYCPRAKRRGRPRQYDPRIIARLKDIWEASDRLCSKRLKPFIPEMLEVLSRHSEIHIDASTQAGLCQMSSSTIDRSLRPYRRTGSRRGIATTKAGSLLKSMIPVRTFTEWQENRPGFVEIDLVAHCGESAEGFFLNTLCGVDVWSGWTECLPVWGKWKEKVRQAIHHMCLRLPFVLLGVDSDNGSEFINQCFYKYCQDEQITFTRSRSYKKNDSCYVEQKNGNIVRRLIGYDRYTTRASFEQLERIYSGIRLYTNFFQPTMKLVSKSRHGARVYKEYEIAQTPYRRLVSSGMLSETKQAEMLALYNSLNPVMLLKQINSNLEQLWRMAEKPVPFGNRNYEATRRSSVTV